MTMSPIKNIICEFINEISAVLQQTTIVILRYSDVHLLSISHIIKYINININFTY